MDHAQIAQLLMRHRTALYAYILANVRNHSDAEDILQNVSLAAIEASTQLGDESGFLPWSLEIARRRILQHFRSLGREQAIDPELMSHLAEAAGRVNQARPASAYQSALQTCLDGLPAASRRLMEMRYDGSVGGVADLAAHLGRSVQSVYAQIKRLKAALRDCVERRLAAEA